jgi:hypothetical protein
VAGEFPSEDPPQRVVVAAFVPLGILPSLPGVPDARVDLLRAELVVEPRPVAVAPERVEGPVPTVLVQHAHQVFEVLLRATDTAVHAAPW